MLNLTSMDKDKDAASLILVNAAATVPHLMSSVLLAEDDATLWEILVAPATVVPIWITVNIISPVIATTARTPMLSVMPSSQMLKVMEETLEADVSQVL